jgi:CRISPR system Cascade subunit CasA
MDNMKARCWYESTMPLIPLRREIHEQYAQNVAGMVLAASQVAGNLRACVKKAWFKRPSDVKGDTSFVDSDLWQMTEDGFYTMLNELRSVLEEGNEATQVMKRWHHSLSQTALSIFDGLAWKGPVEDADPKRVVLARLDLMKSNNSRRITVDLLGLPRLSRKEV